MKLILPYLEFEQPIGTFYMTVIRADVLAEVVDVRRRGDKEARSFSLWAGESTSRDDAVQRQKSEERVRKIANYCEDPDATFPTPIIVSVYKGLDIEDNGHEFIINLPDNGRLGDVIDGQHRLLGIVKSRRGAAFNLPVALMFNMNVEEKAYVFSIINSTQTKVSMSLIFDLFDLSTKRSPQKTCHEIARSLNKMENSPFYNRLKMLGKKEEYQYYATLSQGTFVTQLMTLISRDPDTDRTYLKMRKTLPEYDLPFRYYFLDEEDDVILKILLNCFTALKKVFPDEWKNPSKNVLWKTTGFGGIIKAFPYICKIGKERKNLSEEYFAQVFSNLRGYMQSKHEDFTNRFFSGGGEQLQQKLARYIIESSRSLAVGTNKDEAITTDQKEWLSANLDGTDYDDIYNLYMSVYHVDSYGIYKTIQDAKGKLYVSSDYSDEVLELPNNDTLNKFLQKIETDYCEDMDMESFYSFHKAIEKDD